jgi:glycosyltransferase involved in cell wall biosynthesis
MARPEVSIVLCTNRGGPYLAEAIGSVLAQTLAAWELVVVDDASPDPAGLAASIPDDPRITVERIAHHTVATARNAGCARARGRYLAFLDDDDTWPPDRLARQVDVLEAADEAVVGCCGQLRYVDAEGRPFRMGPSLEGDDAMLTAGFHIGTLLVRRDAAWRAGLFNACLLAGEDVEFGLRLGHLGRVVALPDLVVLDYRRHDDNLTNRRLVYEQHHRVASLAGDTRTRDALARSIAGLERYHGTYALRATRAALRRRDPGGALAPARAAVRSTAAIVRYAAAARVAGRGRG